MGSILRGTVKMCVTAQPDFIISPSDVGFS